MLPTRGTRVRAVALIALLLLVSFAPLLPVAQAQPTGFELSIRQGEAIIRQGGADTQFVAGNSSDLHVIVTVYNDGPQKADGVPIYVWVTNGATGDILVSHKCDFVNVPARSGATPGRSQPKDIALPLPPWREADPKSEYKYRILVNRNPNTGRPAGEDTTAIPTPCGDGLPLGDQNALNNVAFFNVVRDRKMDLVVNDIRWCRGEINDANKTDYAYSHLGGGSNCTADGGRDNLRVGGRGGDDEKQPSVISWWNTTRAWGTTAPNMTYFEVVVGNEPNAAWGNAAGQDRDLNKCALTGQTQQVGDQTLPLTGQDWGSVGLSPTCPGWSYDIEVRIGPHGTQPDKGTLITADWVKPNGLGSWPTKNFSMVNASGDYVVFARVNPTGAFKGDLPSGDSLTRTAQVNSVDLYARFNLNNPLNKLHTSRADPQAYPLDQTVKLEGVVDFFNDGTARPSRFYNNSAIVDPGNPTATPDDPWVIRRWDQPVAWRITLDNQTVIASGTHNQTGNATELEAAPWNETFSASFSTTLGQSNYIRPGRHVLCATVDATNLVMEADEVRGQSNNTHCVETFFSDSVPPTFETVHDSLTPRITLGFISDPTVSTVRPREAFRVHVNATDDDQENLNVTINLTLASDPTVKRYIYPCPALGKPYNAPDCVSRTTSPANSHHYVAPIENLTFNATTNMSVTSESWRVQAFIQDAFHNSAASPNATLNLIRWPVQTVPAASILKGLVNYTASQEAASSCPNDRCPVFYPDGARFSYTSPPVPLSYHIHVARDWTGFVHNVDHARDQPNYTANLNLKVYLPKAPDTAREYPGTVDDHWDSEISCTPIPDDGLPDVGGRDPANPPVDCRYMGNFSAIGLEGLRYNDDGGPGKYNVTIEITDKGGDVRKINASFHLVDAPPLLQNISISANDVRAGDTFNASVNASDDFDINATYLNFTRDLDGRNFSIELTNDTTLTLTGGIAHLYNDTIKTGHGTILGEAGRYSVWFSAVDTFGNWAESGRTGFLLNDTAAPTLIDAGVSPSLQEAGANVTFTAVATDQSNITAVLQVLRGTEQVLKVNMTEDTEPGKLGNFSYTTTFPTEGAYTWTIRVIDSAKLESNLRSGPLSIRDNLGPRFEVRQPGTLIEGQRYARAAPQISFLVYDTDNVSRDTLEVVIEGQKIPLDQMVITPAGGDVRGYIVNYTVPSSKAYAHRALVRVNLTAVDLSSKELVGYSNFTFLVDDVPPTATMAPFFPRYRAEERNVWNVSLQTQFTLTAQDNDGLPTGIDAIRYRVYAVIGSASGTAAEAVYSGPFTIADAPGVYTGPRIYEIDYWAIDAVGNFNRTPERLLFYVDDNPPTIDPFGSLPQGRYVNATFIDDRSGVDRAVVYWRVNGGVYEPIALEYANGVWSAVLPEGRKGDKIDYYLQAWDHVNNTDTPGGNASDPYSSYIVGNHVPKLKLTSPADGSTISRSVELRWNASDEDGDALVYTVYYRAPGRDAFVELARLEAPGTSAYVVDTTRFADGTYTFRVTASDQSFVSLSETTVEIRNRGSPWGTVTPPPAQVSPADKVLIQVQLTKAQAVVEARVYRDGRFVASYPMNDEGRDGDKLANDGIYSASVAMDAAGKYSVEFFTRYQEDGQLKESSLPDAATFAVKLTPGRIFQQYAALIVGVALLAAAGVGIAAWVLLRRR